MISINALKNISGRLQVRSIQKWGGGAGARKKLETTRMASEVESYQKL